MREYQVEWTCKLCGHQHQFRVQRNPSELDDWPNKFDDMACKNQECGMEQDVRTRDCTITEINLTQG
ncbi:MAG TPA: hypothetical protein VJX67_21290 [Blastocatellia bacterium]|nr:hypothetical protein [Blastocatellia bacterium]